MRCSLLIGHFFYFKIFKCATFARPLVVLDGRADCVIVAPFFAAPPTVFCFVSCIIVVLFFLLVAFLRCVVL